VLLKETSNPSKKPLSTVNAKSLLVITVIQTNDKMPLPAPRRAAGKWPLRESRGDSELVSV
jgi:hypothetical protein